MERIFYVLYFIDNEVIAGVFRGRFLNSPPAGGLGVG
jgi:hypothetical protein